MRILDDIGRLTHRLFRDVLHFKIVRASVQESITACGFLCDAPVNFRMFKLVHELNDDLSMSVRLGWLSQGSRGMSKKKQAVKINYAELGKVANMFLFS